MKIAKLKMPLGIILAVAALLAITVVPIMAQPVTSPFSGDVTIDAAAAPDGSEVAAYVADEAEPRGTATTSGGAYALGLIGDASDVGKSVSFKVKKAGTEVWLDATTAPESPTFANYDPQVVDLSAFTGPAPTWDCPVGHQVLISPYPKNGRPFLSVSANLSEVTCDADWFQVYWLNEETGEYLYFISGFAENTLLALQPHEFYLVIVSAPCELTIPQ